MFAFWDIYIFFSFGTLANLTSCPISTNSARPYGSKWRITWILYYIRCPKLPWHHMRVMGIFVRVNGKHAFQNVLYPSTCRYLHYYHLTIAHSELVIFPCICIILIFTYSYQECMCARRVSMRVKSLNRFKISTPSFQINV